jgi:hypothetical protein
MRTRVLAGETRLPRRSVWGAAPSWTLNAAGSGGSAGPGSPVSAARTSGCSWPGLGCGRPE